MGFNFAKAAKQYTADMMESMGSDSEQVSPATLNRPVVNQPDVTTDGLDPAAVGGPAPMNSGQGPYGAPVATDPLLQAPIQPGSPTPWRPGPDEDTTVLHSP